MSVEEPLKNTGELRFWIFRFRLVLYDMCRLEKVCFLIIGHAIHRMASRVCLITIRYFVIVTNLHFLARNSTPDSCVHES